MQDKLNSIETVRYDSGKLRYDLLEPYAIQELVRVFTKGAEKYTANNWLKGGMNYSRMLGSLKRHIAAFEQGEDIDKETLCSHMAHAAWNALGIISYSKYFPELDDRFIPTLNKKQMVKRKLNYEELKELNLKVETVSLDDKENNLRRGQIWFNELCASHPDIAERIRGTRTDPYYDNLKIELFLCEICEEEALVRLLLKK